MADVPESPEKKKGEGWKFEITAEYPLNVVVGLSEIGQMRLE